MSEALTPTARAAAAWGADLPAWVAALAEACEGASQNRVAEQVGYSAAVISQVLKRSYRGDYAAVERRVRAALMGETVVCPVLGEIAATDCHRHQSRPFATTNPLRVRLWRACRSCPHADTHQRREA